jgi:hypothetical protein
MLWTWIQPVGKITDELLNRKMKQLENALPALWPVGAVMGTVSGADPVTLLGFGTWSSLGTVALSETVTYWKRTA